MSDNANDSGPDSLTALPMCEWSCEPATDSAAASASSTDAAASPSGRDGLLRPSIADRDNRGRFTRSNVAALKAGDRSAQQFELQAKERARLKAGILAQLGETDTPPTLDHFLDGTVQALLLRDSAFLRMLELGGPTTAHGRQRPVFAVWQKTRDSVATDLRVLGLKAHAKPVPTPLEYWQQKQREGRPDAS